MRFTGNGRSYFKIWIANLFLSIVTLGAYSAWATVRRLQYFHRNTQLAGVAFDFDGGATTLLVLRMLTISVIGTYVIGFYSKTSLFFWAFLLIPIALPLLIRARLRFGLNNTSYRSLRFDFAGSIGGAYAAYALFTTFFLILPLVYGFGLNSNASMAVLGTFLCLCLCSPLMHGAMRRYVHRHLRVAGLASRFDVPKYRFYVPAFKPIVLLMLALANMAAIIALVMVARAKLGWSTYEIQARSYPSVALGLLTAWIAYLFAGPYLNALTDKLCWSKTSFPGIRIDASVKAGSYLQLQLVNSILTLLSCGLYRPFAVVRAYRYRLACLTVTLDDSLDHALVDKMRDEAIAEVCGQRQSHVDRLQRHWYAALPGLALVLAGATSFALWGMPALAARVLSTLPVTSDQHAGDAAERLMAEDPYSSHSEQTIAQLHEIFRQVTPQPTRIPLRMMIRNLGNSYMGQPALVALPNGLVIINDEMVSHILHYGDRVDDRTGAAFAAFVAHEIGHLEGRHALHALLNSSVMAFGSALFSGDFTDVIAHQPELFWNMRYSSDMETAASNYASARMKQLGWPAPSESLHASLAQYIPRDERNMPGWMATQPSYLRSHPHSGFPP